MSFAVNIDSSLQCSSHTSLVNHRTTEFHDQTKFLYHVDTSIHICTSLFFALSQVHQLYEKLNTFDSCEQFNLYWAFSGGRCGLLYNESGPTTLFLLGLLKQPAEWPIEIKPTMCVAFHLMLPSKNSESQQKTLLFKNIGRGEKAQLAGAVWAGHQDHCGCRAHHFLRGIRPNWGSTAAIAIMGSVKFLAWLKTAAVKKIKYKNIKQ